MANIQPFDIKDLRNKDDDAKLKKNEEDYFSIQVKIPSGK